MGGAGTEREATVASARSTSGSRMEIIPSNLVFPS